MCVWVPIEARRGSQVPSAGVPGSVGHLLLVLGLNSDPMEDQQVLLTIEPSLHPQEKVLFCSFALKILLSWQKVLWSGTGYVAQLVECLPSMQEALGLIPSTAQTRCGGM